jgi:hypothetical protein
MLITEYRKYKRNNEIIFFPSGYLKMAAQKRKFDEAFIKYGFTYIAKGGIQLLQCVCAELSCAEQ